MMYLLIFENISGQELLLLGVLALIFIGPRKLPLLARKISKIMAEFRGATNEFKQTWEREVNFEEEMKAFKIDDTEPASIPKTTTLPESAGITAAPEIREIDKESFEKLRADAAATANADAAGVNPQEENGTTPVIVPTENPELDKRNWL